MTRLHDVTGQRFGRLVAIGRRANKGRNTMWAFSCDCGREVVTYVAAVKRGRTKSCGCFNADTLRANRFKHGASHSPTFRSWAGAKGRCTSPTNAAYADYGGRGITMHPRWLDDFAAFLADMGERPRGTSLDRIDNSCGYEPGNCRWATKLEQAQNKRSNVLIEHDGERVALAEFARRVGLNADSLGARMRTKGETAQGAAAAMLARRSLAAP